MIFLSIIYSGRFLVSSKMFPMYSPSIPMVNTRTPLHDHARKNKGWSDEQVVARWLIMQCVASALLLLIVRG